MIDCSKTENYFAEKRRMTGLTNTYDCAIDCSKCPLFYLNNGTGICCRGFELSYPEKAIAIVQKWSDEHPQKTFLSEFLKHYPNVQLYEVGTPKGICPYHLGLMNKDDCKNRNCVDCWNQPIKGGEE